MMIHDITALAGRYKNRKRVGRGEGSGHGKTSGRGAKGDGFRKQPFPLLLGAAERSAFPSRPACDDHLMPPPRQRARDVRAVRLTTDRVVNRQDASGAWSYRRVRRWTATLLDGSTTVLDYDPTG